ncbi:MAG: 30S ribosomal protein S8 [Candidatus Tectimicrobiota bacterium]
MMTDPVADMLTRIRNALAARHERVRIPASRTKMEIARVLKDEGYIRGFSLDTTTAPQNWLSVELKYDRANMSVIQGVKKISTPGKRHYVACKKIPKVLDGIGIAILSTSRGILTDQQCLAENVGGEILCYVW